MWTSRPRRVECLPAGLKFPFAKIQSKSLVSSQTDAWSNLPVFLRRDRGLPTQWLLKDRGSTPYHPFWVFPPIKSFYTYTQGNGAEQGGLGEPLRFNFLFAKTNNSPSLSVLLFFTLIFKNYSHFGKFLSQSRGFCGDIGNSKVICLVLRSLGFCLFDCFLWC